MLLTRLIRFIGSLQAAGSDVADAVMRGDAAALARLVCERADVNSPQLDGATALHWAVYRGNKEAADPNARVRENTLTRTIFTMQRFYENGAVGMLLGLDPNQANNEGRSPLMGAALKGRPDFIQLLVDRGANLAAHDRGSRDTHIPGATIAGFTFQAVDYAEGLVRVGVQSAVERPETAKLIRQLMQERNLPVPPAGRTLNSICVVALCQAEAQ